MTWDQMQELMWPATQETLQMVGVSTVVTVLIGLPLGVLLVLTDKGGLLANRAVNKVLAFVVNIARSVPFIILMIALITFTRWLVGTSIGWQAATVPLTIGAIPFFARLVETSVREVDRGLVEAVQSMGGSTWTIVRKTLLPEALPALAASVTTTIITLVSYSAMAGVVGGGGLGTLAVNYGYYRFETAFMWVIVAELVIIVQIIQMLGDYAVRRLGNRGRSGLFGSRDRTPAAPDEDLVAS
ncbi:MULTISPECIES: methionine ABC transporter permease [unclassified Kitasatospora]|uniref:methionine ABC transporter permease n=1 Tax=unclassified Kitasatospora TaxID=2633591 RepID=UPI0024734116|nr:methionine ABC transporter permease [Kitasatospora sp. MAA19]MDH6707997.1 D-methionine transport system permease protein [Kitasatospora sp. MAA19]